MAHDGSTVPVTDWVFCRTNIQPPSTNRPDTSCPTAHYHRALEVMQRYWKLKNSWSMEFSCMNQLKPHINKPYWFESATQVGVAHLKFLQSQFSQLPSCALLIRCVCWSRIFLPNLHFLYYWNSMADIQCGVVSCMAGTFLWHEITH